MGPLRVVIPATVAAALILTPLSQASAPRSARIEPDAGTAVSLGPYTDVRSKPGRIVLGVRREWASSPTAYELKIALGPTESLAKLPDGSIAIVAPWPADVLGPGDGTDYMSPASDPGERELLPPTPLPVSDPYRYSADPDGSMAADEALHDVGPFDPAYPDEYLPDTGSDDRDDPDSPANANSGPPPRADTSDTVEPADNERVPEFSPLDALYEAEASRSDQIVALLAAPQAADALGRRVAARLGTSAPDIVELRFASVFPPAFPVSATSSLTFNPDASTTSKAVRSP